jgi:hypothetical protein
LAQNSPDQQAYGKKDRFMRFRKKPVIIDAYEWDGTKTTLGMLRGIPSLEMALCSHNTSADGKITNLHIRTLEGQLHVSNGDFIIKGIEGEFYPCKPDIFKKTYEPADYLAAS